jgi:hypothetical protein
MSTKSEKQKLHEIEEKLHLLTKEKLLFFTHIVTEMQNGNKEYSEMSNEEFFRCFDNWKAQQGVDIDE